MDRKNWPWRKKSNNNTIIMSTNTGLHSALDISLPNSSTVSPAIVATSPSFETCVDKPGTLPPVVSSEKKKPLFLPENAIAVEALAWKEEAEQKLKTLNEKLEDAERELMSKEAMVKQHAKVAEEAVSGWETAESEAVFLKQELAASMQQRNVIEGRVAELDDALKVSMKQMRQAQEEQQQKTKDTIDKKMQEWGKMKAEMEEVEKDLRQRILAAEAQSCAMAKSLEERARAITEWQEGKERAEMEAGLLQVKLESQATEMAAVKYELRMLSKEFEIRNRETEFCRKESDAAHKQHLEDVKKITKLDSECQRLRNLVRKRLPGPAAIAQMKMEAEKSEQSKRRRSLGSSGSSQAGACEAHSSSHQGANITESVTSCQDMAQKLLDMEEEAKLLKETLAKKTAELHSARQMCARTANKLSVAEDQLESFQGTPSSVRSTQISTLDSFILRSQATNGASSEKLDDEVSCAESWASALITELAHFKKVKQSTDLCVVDSTPDRLHDAPNKPSTESTETQKQALDSCPAPGDYVTLKALATKDAQLQSANLMCKDAMAKLASAEAKLGGTWMSENPRSNVQEGVNSVGEAHGIMSKLDKILDDMRIAVASVGDATDDDNSDNGISSSLVKGAQPTSTVALGLDSLKEQVETQAKKIDDMQMQVGASEAAKAELERQLHKTEKELHLVNSELEDARMQIKELKESTVSLQKQQGKELAEEQAKRGEVQAQLEAKQSEVRELQNNVASLAEELADRRREHEAAVAKCEALDRKLQDYVDREHSLATSCRFEGDSDARARKEREVAAAKEKLAECQRTILVLGKQLTSFTSPSSASFDSNISLHYGPLDTNQDQEVDHTHKMRTRLHQRRPLPYNSVNPHDGSNHPSANSNTHVSNFTKPPQVNAAHYSKPRRIHSDLSCRAGSTNPVAGQQYSVAEHLQMDDGVSSFYDSLPDSATSSPSSQYNSPTRTFGSQRHINKQGGVGVRTNLAKSLERVAAPRTVAANGRSGEGNGEVGGNGVKSLGRAAIAVEAVHKNGGGKANKSLSRFFGRSKK